MRKISGFVSSLAGFVLLLPAVASAHVVVTPSSGQTAQELVFSVSSPNERQDAIVKLTLDIPAGVGEVSPTVKSGWTIYTTTRQASGESQVASIVWEGGSIPAGQRDDFSFSAQLPTRPTTVQWKATQTYADGTVVHWDQTPNGSDDADGTSGPFSATKVTDSSTDKTDMTSTSSNTLPLILSIVALVFSLIALQRSKK